MSTLAAESFALGRKGLARKLVHNQLVNPSSQLFLLNSGLKAGMTVLDLSCGIGMMSCWLAKKVGTSGRVIAIDSNWAATGWLTVGGRYAFKIAELRPSRDRSAQWFDSTLHYFAGRADIAFTKEWDFMVEGRLLETEESGSSRYGAVMTLHRHLNDQVRLGLGYNFARFSDDLFDTSGRSMGAFINLTGAW